MKKYFLTGNIFGFAPNLYLNKPYWGKLDELWSAQVDDFLTKGEEMLIRFNWQGVKYSVVIKAVNSETESCQGRIIADGEAVGKVFLKRFNNKTGNLFWGDWQEENKNYNVLIEIFFEHNK